MYVALPKYICLRSFENQNMFYMSTWKLSFYTAIFGNVGGHPIFHAILGNVSQFLMRLSKLFLNFS
jgi:hypothetical protein